MNILFLVDSSSPSDEQRLVQTLMRNIPADGYNKHVIFMSGNIGDLQCQSMPNVAFDCSFLHGQPDQADNIAKFIGRRKIDVLVTFHNQFINTTTVSIMDKSNRLPKVVYIVAEHGDEPRQAAGLLQRFNPVFCSVSQLIADRELSGLPVTVLHPGVPYPQGEGRDAKLALNIPPQAKVIGYMGRIDKSCNLAMLIDVANRTKAWLLLCGVGPMVPNMFEQGPTVKMMPGIPELRADWFNAMNIFCYPVRASGVPTLAIEAMLAGVPTCMTPVSDVHRNFGDQVALHGLSKDSLLEAMNKAASRPIPPNVVAEAYSVERFVEEFTTLLQSAVGTQDNK